MPKRSWTASLLCGLAALAAGCAPPFMRAAGNGDDAQVLAFLNSGTDVNQDYDGATALTYAAVGGRVSTLKLLLEHGADPKSDPHALCSAVLRDSIPVVQLLIDHGAPLNEPVCVNPYTTKVGWTALDLAEVWPKPAIAAYLRKRGAVHSAGGGQRGSLVGGGAAAESGPAGGGAASASGGMMRTSAGSRGSAVDDGPDEGAAPAPAPQPSSGATQASPSAWWR